MVPNAKRRSLESIWATWGHVEDCESVFLSPGDLQAFGIEARQVDTMREGIPQFDPRFFEPYPAGDLRQYQIKSGQDLLAEAMGDNNIRDLQCRPTLKDALNTVRHTLPFPEDPLEAAQKLFEERLAEYNSWGDYTRADWIHMRIDRELGAQREGQDPLFRIEDLAGLQDDIPSRRGDPSMFQVTAFTWKYEILREEDHDSPLPHAICTILADVDATIADQNLTLHELRAIMRMIAIRARGSRRDHPIWPFLLLSFMGKQHGRIIQIVVEEGQIMLQYSKLWSFEVKETAPVELFVRHILCQPVGIERP